MIKLVKAKHVRDYIIKLTFSNGAYGEYDFSSHLNKNTVLTTPLKELKSFKGFYLELGALCWKNGLEFSPAALFKDLETQGKLTKTPQAA